MALPRCRKSAIANNIAKAYPDEAASIDPRTVVLKRCPSAMPRGEVRFGGH